jgi:hypothetical protein
MREGGRPAPINDMATLLAPEERQALMTHMRRERVAP